jgi:peptide/nickel transport system permease protein
MVRVGGSGVVGTRLGVVGGYRGGFIDHVLGWLFDLLFSIPSYLLGILVVVVAGPGLVPASLAIGVAFIPQFGRVARGLRWTSGPGLMSRRLCFRAEVVGGP